MIASPVSSVTSATTYAVPNSPDIVCIRRNRRIQAELFHTLDQDWVLVKRDTVVSNLNQLRLSSLTQLSDTLMFRSRYLRFI